MSNLDTYGSAAVQAAETYGIPPSLFLGQINQESGFNPSAFNSSSGATGIAQFLPTTANAVGLNPSDPIASLNAAAQYDASLFSKYGNWTDALAAYGGGLVGGNVTPNGNAYVNAVQAQASSSPIDNFLSSVGLSSLSPMFTGNPAGSGGTGAGGALDQAGGGTPAWLAALEKYLGNISGSILFVVLGIVILIAALVMFAKDQGVEVPNVRLPPIPVE